MLRLILMPVFAGFVATIGITATLWTINKSGWTNADMVRAVGSFFTKSFENSLRVGIFIHFINGMFFAGIYLHLLSVLHTSNLGSEILIGGLMGFAQGFAVSYLIVKFADKHPLPEFQKADYQVALAHIVGHVVYGLLLGAIFGFMRMAGFDVSPGF